LKTLFIEVQLLLYLPQATLKQFFPYVICWIAGCWLWTRRRFVWGDTGVVGEASREKIKCVACICLSYP
jgi:hypothetical protein